MHRCFKIPEIVQEICQHLGHDPFWYLSRTETAESRRAPVSLSRTRSQFQEPATGELWSQIGSSYGLEPSLHAIADDLWECNVLQGQRDRQLKREIRYADIISFKQRASRIRRLCVLVHASSTASIRSLAAIAVASAPEDSFLFPRLQELRLMGSICLEDVTPFSIVLGPSISVLRIGVPLSNNNKNLSFLASVTRRCLNLTEVAFGNSVVVPFYSSYVPYCGLGSLEALELIVDTTQGIAILSYLPLLQNLTMTISNSIDITKDSMTPGTGGFPSPARLSCNSRLDLSPCLWAILLLTPSAPLNSLVLSSKRQSGEVHDDAVPLVEAATELLDDPFHLEYLQEYRSLKYIHIEVMTPVSTGLQPLLALDHLDLETLVVGLFSDPVYGQCTPKIKLQDLIEILAAFPSLTTLGLPIDATVVPSSSKRPGKGFEHEQVLMLLVGSSPIQSPQNVAEFLSDIVPEVEGIAVPQSMIPQNGRWAVDNPNAAKWEKVEQLVPFIARIREQERNTAYFGHSESDEE
ncbi:hypothetical protein BKA70DRAFT_1576967 [Coprinopsis sp. MPI-PUGE-AT-0042]|nr:hypothetical protein BKA70DRAFT_1576967 [Coprinopsis sp. MPI-PUGE-AT-0042]